MLISTIRTLYAYNAWANARVLAAASQLTGEQFTTPVPVPGASFRSVRDTLVHTLGAQRHWLARFRQWEPPEFLTAETCPDLTALQGHWDAVETDTQTFVAALDNDLLGTVITYTTRWGRTYSYPLWQMMIHQVNHATHHRSESAMLLAHWGQSPGELGFITYIDEQTAGA